MGRAALAQPRALRAGGHPHRGGDPPSQHGRGSARPAGAQRVRRADALPARELAGRDRQRRGAGRHRRRQRGGLHRARRTLAQALCPSAPRSGRRRAAGHRRRHRPAGTLVRRYRARLRPRPVPRDPRGAAEGGRRLCPHRRPRGPGGPHAPDLRQGDRRGGARHRPAAQGSGLGVATLQRGRARQEPACADPGRTDAAGHRDEPSMPATSTTASGSGSSTCRCRT